MSRQLIRVLVTVWSIVVALPLAAQPALSPEGIDTVRRNFVRIDAAVNARIRTSGWGDVPTNRQDTLRHLQRAIKDQLNRLADKKAGPQGSGSLAADLRKYVDFVDAIYRSAVPAQVNAWLTELHRQFLDAVGANNDEYFRRFFIKYGENSERLNFLEVHLNNSLLSGDPAGGRLPMPSPWEPIIRITVLGYQTNDRFRTVDVSSPIYQVGITRYLFADNWIARLVNHVGLAVAYEDDLARNVSLGGLILHVRTLDLGLMCGSWQCEQPTVAASMNLQLLRKPFRF